MENYNAFYRSVKRNPSAVAIISNGRHCTYDELNELIDTVCSALILKSVTKGSIVGIYMHPGIAYIATILAVNKLGGIFMPLEPSHPVKRLETMVTKIVPSLLVTEEGQLNDLKDIFSSNASSNAIEMIVINSMAKQLDRSNKDENSVDGEADGLTSCYLFYTSGSTGEPKAIEGTVEGLDHFIKWEIGEFHLDESVRIPLLAPLSFDVSLRDIFVPLYVGGTICIPESEIKHNTSRFLHWVIENKISLIHMVPSMFRLVIAEFYSSPKLMNLDWQVKHILLAGEPLFNTDVKAWHGLNHLSTELVNLYGPSETSLAKLYFRIDKNASYTWEVIPLGYPIPGADVKIMKDGIIAQIGEIGEITIETTFRSKGYYNDPTLTNQKFIRINGNSGSNYKAYKTGDFGRLLEDGAVQFIGRQDSMVKINGNRVELQEIEAAINSYDLISQSVVTTTLNSPSELELVGYYVAKEELKIEELRNFLSDKLPVYMIPTYFIQLDHMPLNFNGKVDRKALPKPKRNTINETYVPCENETELIIESIWRDILKVEKIGRSTSFFSIGGSSLKAIQIISRVQKEFNVLIKLAYFLSKPMVKDLAFFIDTQVVQKQKTLI